MEVKLGGCVLGILATEGTDGGHVARLREELRARGLRTHVLAAEGEAPHALDGSALEVDGIAEEVGAGYYDGLIVPGGTAGVAELSSRRAILELVRVLVKDNRPVGAIEDGVRLLQKAGVLDGRHVSGPPGLVEELDDAEAIIERKPVTADGPVVTCADADQIALFVEHYARVVQAYRVEDNEDEASEDSFPASDVAHGGAYI